MLGLGNAIIKSGKIRSPIYKYQSSFDSTIGDWTFTSSNDNTDENTVEIGQNAPGEPTTNDWLKITINSYPGGSFGLRLDTHVAGDWLPYQYSRLSQDLITIEYMLHVVDGGGGSIDPVTGLVNQAGAVLKLVHVDGVALDTTTEVKTSHIMGGNLWNQNLKLYVSGLGGPSPKVNDIIYIKDVCIILWR